MKSSDTYKEINEPEKGIYKEKGSKFISYIYPVYSHNDIKNILEKIKKIEYSAHHYCYAYILGSDKSEKRTNDDGEPSSTAGKPILGKIESNNLTNTLIIVARYFGGEKLGVPGLIRSYKTAAANAISNAKIIEKKIQSYYQIFFLYNDMNDVMRLIKEFKLKIIDTDFQIDCNLVFAVSRGKEALILESFQKNHKLKINYLKTE